MAVAGVPQSSKPKFQMNPDAITAFLVSLIGFLAPHIISAIPPDIGNNIGLLALAIGHALHTDGN